MGVPLHFWAEPTFRSIGEALGEVEQGVGSVDSDIGRVRVTLDGFKPLCFEMSIEFYSGEEVSITLRYERLFGYCLGCFSLCHDAKECLTKEGKETKEEPSHDDENGDGNLSYKGAVIKGRGEADLAGYREEKRRGKRPIGESRPGSNKNGRSHDDRRYRAYDNTRTFGELGRRQRGRVQGPSHEDYKERERNSVEEANNSIEEGQVSETVRPIQLERLEKELGSGRSSAQKVRKALFQAVVTDPIIENEEKKQQGGEGTQIQVVDDVGNVLVPMQLVDDVLAPMEEDETVTKREEEDEIDGLVQAGDNEIKPNREQQAVEVQEVGLENLEKVEVETEIRVPTRRKVGKGSHAVQVVSSKKMAGTSATISEEKRRK